MKIIKLEDSEDITHLRKDEQEKVAKLKVIGDHLYTSGIGVKDGKYFLLTETKTDHDYCTKFLTSDAWNDEEKITGKNGEGLREFIMDRPPPDNTNGSLVFVKHINGVKHLFRTTWDLEPLESYLCRDNS